MSTNVYPRFRILCPLIEAACNSLFDNHLGKESSRINGFTEVVNLFVAACAFARSSGLCVIDLDAKSPCPDWMRFTVNNDPRGVYRVSVTTVAHHFINERTQMKIFSLGKKAKSRFAIWQMRRVAWIIVGIGVLLYFSMERNIADASDLSDVVKVYMKSIPFLVVGFVSIIFFFVFKKNAKIMLIVVDEKSISFRVDKTRQHPSMRMEDTFHIAGKERKLFWNVEWRQMRSIDIQGKYIHVRGKGGVPLFNTKNFLIPHGIENQSELAKEIVQYCPKETLHCTYEELSGNTQTTHHQEGT